MDKKLADVQQSLRDLETVKDTVSKSTQDVKTEIADMKNELAKQQVMYILGTCEDDFQF
jgi:outer membrane protein assembly factor BamE (lipoprotein component of BamABCDE complex)